MLTPALPIASPNGAGARNTSPFDVFGIPHDFRAPRIFERGLADRDADERSAVGRRRRTRSGSRVRTVDRVAHAPPAAVGGKPRGAPFSEVDSRQAVTSFRNRSAAPRVGEAGQPAADCQSASAVFLQAQQLPKWVSGERAAPALVLGQACLGSALRSADQAAARMPLRHAKACATWLRPGCNGTGIQPHGYFNTRVFPTRVLQHGYFITASIRATSSCSVAPPG